MPVPPPPASHLAWAGLVLACDPIPVIFGDLLPGFFLSNFHAKPSGDLCAGPARRLASSGSEAPGHWGRHPAKNGQRGDSRVYRP